MLLGILSDTHDELARVHRAVQILREAGADTLVHCGDLASPPIVEALAALPSWFVFGNHDADSVPALKQASVEFGPICLGWSGMVELGGKLIAVVHGHLSHDIRLALRQRPHYLLSGHSHIADDRKDGLVRRINPGALSEADQLTVALLDLETDELRFLTVPGELVKKSP